MQAPEKPANEALRIDTLRALNILDTPPEERFDRLTRLARVLFGVPVALVSLVDESRQWFKSCMGLGIPELPRGISFCGHAILGDDVFLVPDAARDDRFHDNPLVTYEPHLRFYAGCPLAAANGSKLGTLSLVDRVAREFSGDARKLLRDLARMAEQELAPERIMTMDILTQLSNRRGFETLALHALDLCRRLELQASLLYFNLEHLQQINDRYGHAEGDHALCLFARLLRQTFRGPDVTARIGGDEFAVLLANTGRTDSNAVLYRLLQNLEQYNHTSGLEYEIVASVSVVGFAAARHADAADMLAEATALMRRQKQQRYGTGKQHGGSRIKTFVRYRNGG